MFFLDFGQIADVKHTIYFKQPNKKCLSMKFTASYTKTLQTDWRYWSLLSGITVEQHWLNHVHHERGTEK